MTGVQTCALPILQNLLKTPDGIMIITLPLGYNKVLNEHLENGFIKFHEQFYLIRMGKNDWKESSWDQVKNVKFNHPYPGANGLVIGINRADKT